MHHFLRVLPALICFMHFLEVLQIFLFLKISPSPEKIRSKREIRKIFTGKSRSAAPTAVLSAILFLLHFLLVFFCFSRTKIRPEKRKNPHRTRPRKLRTAPLPESRRSGRKIGFGKQAEASRKSRRYNLRRREKPGKKTGTRGRKSGSGNPFKTVKTAAGKSEKETASDSGFPQKREKTPPRNTPGSHRKSRQKTGVRIRTFPILSIYLWMLRLCLAPVGGGLHRPLPFYGFSPALPRRFVSSLKKW